MEEVQQSPAGQGGAAACQLHQVRLSTRALTFFLVKFFVQITLSALPTDQY